MYFRLSQVSQVLTFGFLKHRVLREGELRIFSDVSPTLIPVGIICEL